MQATTHNSSPVDKLKGFQRDYWRALIEISNSRAQGGDGGGYHGVFWYGFPGTGKTFLAQLLVGEAARSQLRVGDHGWRPVKVFAGNALDLVAETQAAIGRDKEARTQFQMLREIHVADLVFLDDLGREREDYGQTVMFSLLDRALASNATVIVTANRNAKDLAEYYHGDVGLRSRLSALKQMEWPDTLPNLRKAAVAEALAHA